ncbi:MAG: TetR/AcrR family transcriptional regulator [Candidatus Woesearchaeota archaeon]
MPRGFTDREIKEINRSLINEGEKLFVRYGLKKTSIKDLTNRVGIAQGSFYKFFSSKEELYFDIIEKNEADIKAEILNDKILSGKINKNIFRNFLKKAFKAVDNYPLIKNMYHGDEYQQLFNKLPKEKIEAHINNDTDDLRPLLSHLQQIGKLKECDIDAVSGLLRSLFLLTLHKKEIGEDHFEKTIDLFIDLIVEGLIIEE